MADTKISGLTALTGANTASGDLLTIVDVSDITMAATGTNKKITLTELQGAPVSAGTANGVLYLNGSKVATSGSALTFDGTNLGIGLSTLDAKLNVNGYSGNGTLRIGGGTTGESVLYFADSGSGVGSYAGFLQYLHSSDNLVFGAASAERMRLTSTGLGIGTSSPGTKLDVAGNAALTGTSGYKYVYFNITTDTNTIRGAKIGKTYDSPWDLAIHASTGTSGGGNEAAIKFYRNNTDVSATIDSSGNLGLGVTPSAWASGLISLDLRSEGFISGGGNYLSILSNVYFNSGARYKTTGFAATEYLSQGGAHIWRTAPSGTAGNAITFTQAMTLDASGNLGVGTTSPSDLLHIAKATAADAYLRSSNSLAVSIFGTAGDGSTYVFNNSAYPIKFFTNATERARIDSAGRLLVGKTSFGATTAGFQVNGDTGSGSFGSCTSTLAASVNGNTTYEVYSTGAAAYRFYVGLGGTVYATSTTITAISDQRLKENIRDLDDGLATVMALKPRKFDWKDGKGKDIKNDRGFIAQEFEQILPDMIEEWRDPAPEGEEPYKAINANLIPTLVKAIQEQQAQIESLRKRLADAGIA